jgi:hypothetical protein
MAPPPLIEMVSISDVVLSLVSGKNRVFLEPRRQWRDGGSVHEDQVLEYGG